MLIGTYNLILKLDLYLLGRIIGVDVRVYVCSRGCVVKESRTLLLEAAPKSNPSA